MRDRSHWPSAGEAGASATLGMMNHNAPKMMAPSPLFRSFFMGGFECSTFKRPNGERLDLVASTKHDQFCDQDYQRLKSQGLCVAREGIRWHLIERGAGRYDFSSVRPMLSAARAHGIQVLWDICHYGWPDDLEIMAPEFIDR